MQQVLLKLIYSLALATLRAIEPDERVLPMLMKVLGVKAQKQRTLAPPPSSLILAIDRIDRIIFHVANSRRRDQEAT
jgi:hypothetical protein